MVKSGLLVRLEAAPGNEAEVEKRITALLARVQKEAGTRLWLMLRFGPTSFGVFNGFADATARNAHLAGEVMARLRETSSGLLAGEPTFEDVDVLAAKLPR